MKRSLRIGRWGVVALVFAVASVALQLGWKHAEQATTRIWIGRDGHQVWLGEYLWMGSVGAAVLALAIGGLMGARAFVRRWRSLPPGGSGRIEPCNVGRYDWLWPVAASILGIVTVLAVLKAMSFHND
jgi:hypothetical protein